MTDKAMPKFMSVIRAGLVLIAIFAMISDDFDNQSKIVIIAGSFIAQGILVVIGSLMQNKVGIGYYLNLLAPFVVLLIITTAIILLDFTVQPIIFFFACVIFMVAWISWQAMRRDEARSN